MARFSGKSVIVTGAASGFGKAIAEKFATEGASVIVADLNIEGARHVAESLPQALPFAIDVSDESMNKALVETAADAYGKIDVYCANAGIPHLASQMVKMEVVDFDRMFAVNVRSIFLAAKYATPHMPAGSSLISTSSMVRSDRDPVSRPTMPRRAQWLR